MDNYTLAIISALIYFCIKMIEKRVLKKDITNKDIVRNSVLVGSSVFSSIIILGYFNTLTGTKNYPEVFINEPGF